MLQTTQWFQSHRWASDYSEKLISLFHMIASLDKSTQWLNNTFSLSLCRTNLFTHWIFCEIIVFSLFSVLLTANEEYKESNIKT